MGRPKKEKPNHATGMYEVKVTVGHTFDGKPVRKSFYSSVSKEAAKAKAEQYKIDQAVAEQTGETFVGKEECFDTWAIKWLETYKHDKNFPISQNLIVCISYSFNAFSSVLFI